MRAFVVTGFVSPVEVREVATTGPYQSRRSVGTWINNRDARARRRARFGDLPPRILPEDWIEENETDPPAHELASSMPIAQHPGTVNAT